MAVGSVSWLRHHILKQKFYYANESFKFDELRKCYQLENIFKSLTSVNLNIMKRDDTNWELTEFT